MEDGLVLSNRIFKVRLALSLRNEVGLACFDPGLIASVVRFHGAEWIDACEKDALQRVQQQERDSIPTSRPRLALSFGGAPVEYPAHECRYFLEITA